MVPYQSLRAEITLGLRQGQNGPIFSESDVVAFLKEEVTRAKAAGKPWLPLRIIAGTVVYSSETEGKDEPCLILSSDRNPRYNAELSDEDWRTLVQETATSLARKFEQERVYVTYLPAEVVIVTR